MRGLGPSVFLETGLRGVCSGILTRSVGGGDKRATSGMSSNDGALSIGAAAAGAGSTRMGMDAGTGVGDSGGGALETICGCVAAFGGVTGAVGAFETGGFSPDLWIPQKSVAGSRNSTSI